MLQALFSVFTGKVVWYLNSIVNDPLNSDKHPRRHCRDPCSINATGYLDIVPGILAVELAEGEHKDDVRGGPKWCRLLTQPMKSQLTRSLSIKISLKANRRKRQCALVVSVVHNCTEVFSSYVEE